MSFTLLELETTVVNLLHAAASAFSTPNSVVVHRSCRAACNKFMRETRCSWTSVEVDITEGDTSIDITATAADFEPGCLLPVLSLVETNTILTQVVYTKIVSMRNLGGSTPGEPRLIAWPGAADDGQIFPEADDDYTLLVPYWRPKVTFTPGATGSGVTIDIPETYIDAVACGALANLLIAFPGYDGRNAQAQFENAIYQAKGQISAKFIALSERHRGFDDGHMRDGYI